MLQRRGGQVPAQHCPAEAAGAWRLRAGAQEKKPLSPRRAGLGSRVQSQAHRQAPRPGPHHQQRSRPLRGPLFPGRRAAAAPHRPSPRSAPRRPRAAAGSGPHRPPGVAALGRRRAPRPRCPQPARPAPPRSASRANQDAAVSRATGTRPGLPPPFPSYWTLDSRSRPLKANKVGEARQGKGRGRVSVARRPPERGLVSSLI